MGTCKRCGQESIIYKAELCPDCYKLSKNLLSEYKKSIAELIDKANPSLSAAAKEMIINNAIKLQDDAIESKLPITKEMFRNDLKSIRKNLGLQEKGEGIKTKALFALCALLALFSVISSVMLAINARQVNSLRADISELRSYNEYLEAENSVLRLGDTAGKKVYVLENGNYLSGKDFEPGTYDIEALSGQGTVHSSNAFEGGINAMLGNEPNQNIEGYNTADFYEKKYVNVELPEGVALTIDKVKIRLTRVS